MTVTRPVVAILIGEGVRRQVLDRPALDELGAKCEVLLPDDSRKLPEDAVRLVARADGCMTGWGSPALTESLLASAPRLKIMAHAAGSVKPFVTDALWKRGITVTSVAAAIAVDVAHAAVALMVIGCKNIMEVAALTGAGRWTPADRAKALSGHRNPDDLRRSTVGIVGAGHVGRQVLDLIRRYEVTALLADPFVDEAGARALGARKVELDELFEASDVVSLHAPDVPATRHIVNAARLASMKTGAILINTARGGLVDEAALVAELKRRRIWAFLDVTDPEPPPAGSPLYGCPNLTLTPHIAGASGRARVELGRMAVRELLRCFAGEPPLHPVTAADLGRLA